MEQQAIIQRQLNELLSLKSDAAITAALLSRLSCPPQVMDALMVGVMKSPQLDQRRILALTIENCKDTLEKEGLHPLSILKDFNAVDDKENFIKSVENGRQFYTRHLYKDAAETWKDAIRLIPQSYIDDHSIDFDMLESATAALRRVPKTECFAGVW